MFHLSAIKLVLPFALLLLASQGTHAHTRFTGLELNFIEPAVIGVGAPVTISFEYFTDEPAGFTMVANPYFEGILDPNTVAILPSFPNGTGTGSFTFNASVAMDVDEIVIYAIANDREEVLERFYLPVDFKVRENAAWISSFSIDQPAALPHSQTVTATVEYRYNGVGDGLLWVSPHQGTPLAPNFSFAASGPISGFGSLTRTFSVSSGVNVAVDNVRVLMEDGSSALLVDYRIPVRYWWSTSGVRVAAVVKDDLAGRLDAEIAYQNNEPEGLRISLEPILDVGSFTSYSDAGTAPVFGTGTRNMHVSAVEPTTAQTRALRVRAFTDGGSGDIVVFDYPLKSPWMKQRSVDVSNVKVWPGTVGRTSTWQLIYLSFDYQTATAGSRRFFARPEGPFQGANASPAYPALAGTAFGWFFLGQERNNGIINIRVSKDGSEEEVIPMQVGHLFYEPPPPVLESIGITESGNFEVLWEATPPENYRILRGNNLPVTMEIWRGSSLPSVEEIFHSEPVTPDRMFFQVERLLDPDLP